MTPEEERLSADEREVSRLLAEAAAGTEPLPEEVGARLDDVLADLVRERANRAADAPPESGQMVPMAGSDKGRRRWSQVLLAAAAVVVVGYGATVVTQQVSSDGTDNAETADAGVDARGQAGSDSEPGFGAPDMADGRRDAILTTVPVRLRSDQLEADVVAALDGSVASSGGTALDERSDTVEKQGLRSTCPPPPLAERERWAPARYDGQRAVLVTGPERDGFVEATVYTCSGERLADVEVPSP